MTLFWFEKFGIPDWNFEFLTPLKLQKCGAVDEKALSPSGDSFFF